MVDLLRLKAAIDSGTPFEEVVLHLPLQASGSARLLLYVPAAAMLAWLPAARMPFSLTRSLNKRPYVLQCIEQLNC